MRVYRIGVMNDTHHPWHDKRAVDLVLDIFEDSHLDEIVLNGDILDFYNINSHGPKHPEVQETLESELESGLDFLTNLRKRFPKIKIHFNAGNHEYRLDRFIMNHCPAFWNLVRIENQLQLNHLNIEWAEYNYRYRVLNTNLYIQHSPPSYSENTAMTSLKKNIGASFIYGCTHRRDYACKTMVDGTEVEVYSNGWLGSYSLTPEHARVFSYAKGHQNWQQAFAIITAVGKDYFINQHSIKNYRCVVEGHIYEG